MTISSDDVLGLVSAIYEAALEPGRWPAFLQALNEALGSGSAVLHLHSNGTSRGGRILAAVGADPAFQREYDDYYASVNIWAIRGQPLLREGAVLTGQMACPDRELERSEYYNDYLTRLGFYHALAAVPAADGGEALILALLAPKSRGPFEDPALAVMRHLMPHLKRAARIRGLLIASELEWRAVATAIDRLPFGLVLLDAALRMRCANRAARAIADAGDGFELASDGPAAAVAQETCALRRLLLAAARTSPIGVGGACDGSVARLTRPSGKRPLEALVVPLGDTTREPFDGHHAAVALFILDPDNAPPSSEGVLRRLYGLTPAEARVASALAGGASVATLAERLALTENTARWMVKQVLQKTGTRSQAQAVALIARGAAALRA